MYLIVLIVASAMATLHVAGMPMPDYLEGQAVPVLSDLSVDNITPCCARFQFTTDLAGTYYYMVIKAEAYTPKATMIKAQLGTAAARGTGTATAGENVVQFTSTLSSATSYKVCIVLEDVEWNLSAISTVNFITPAAAPAPTIDPTGPIERLIDSVGMVSPASVVLTATGGSVYKWYIDRDPVGDESSANFTATVGGHYFARYYDSSTGCWSQKSASTYIHDAPARMYWVKIPMGFDWYDPENWSTSSSGHSNEYNTYPGKFTTVFIHGDSQYFPILDSLNSDRCRLVGPPVLESTKNTQDDDVDEGYEVCASVGEPCCDSIVFGFGAEMAQPHYLHYNKAFIYYATQYYNDDYSVIYNDGESHPDDQVGFASPSMVRGQWYALAAPLKKVVTGDFSFGGYPYTWQQQFKSTRVTYDDDETRVLTGGWHPTDPNLALEIGAHMNYAICLFIPKYNNSVLGVNDHTHLQNLKGAIKLPYFEDSFSDPMHPAHSYDSGISKIHYFLGQDGFQLIEDMYDEIERGEEAYRFVFEDENNLPLDSFKIRLPITDKDGDNENDEVMVGNPFVSSLDLSKLFEVNSSKMEQFYRIYGNSSFQTDPIGDYDTIAVLQAFFVQPIGEVGTEVELVFTKDMSIARENYECVSQLKSDKSSTDKQQGIIRLTVSNAIGSNYTTFVFHGEDKKNVDWMYYNSNMSALSDKQSVYSNPVGSYSQSAPQIYSLDDKKRERAIRYINTNTNSLSNEMPLGIHVQGNARGSYKLRMESVGNLNLKAIQLLDKLTGKKISPKDDNVYEFTVADTDPNYLKGRFSLLIGQQILEGSNNEDALGLHDAMDDIYVFADGRRLQVTSAGEDINELTVTGMQGIRIAAESDIRQPSWSMQLPQLAQGVYIVRIRLANGATRVKKLKIES
jgi:hypothetical protein